MNTLAGLIVHYIVEYKAEAHQAVGGETRLHDMIQASLKHL